MKIEAGRFYRTRGGLRAGPITTAAPGETDDKAFVWKGMIGDWQTSWTRSGRWWSAKRDDLYDLVAEWVDPAPTPDPRDAEIAELRAALKPFADEAPAWHEYVNGEPLVEGFPGVESCLTVGDLRRAHAALSRQEAASDE